MYISCICNENQSLITFNQEVIIYHSKKCNQYQIHGNVTPMLYKQEKSFSVCEMDNNTISLNAIYIIKTFNMSELNLYKGTRVACVDNIVVVLIDEDILNLVCLFYDNTIQTLLFLVQFIYRYWYETYINILNYKSLISPSQKNKCLSLFHKCLSEDHPICEWNLLIIILDNYKTIQPTNIDIYSYAWGVSTNHILSWIDMFPVQFIRQWLYDIIIPFLMKIFVCQDFLIKNI